MNTSKTFLENIGSASTSATLNHKKLGHDVNACAYEKGEEIVVYLESNGIIVKQAGCKSFDTYADFENWKDSISGTRELFVAAIESFGATVLI